MMTTIVQKGDPVLRQMAEPVPMEDIGSIRIQNILRDMEQALETEEDGVALAAPQVGIALRIFIVSPRLFLTDNDDVHRPAALERIKKQHPLAYINPAILKTSRKKVSMEEGCLSVRWLYGHVERAERATVAAYGADGKVFTRGASGLLAQIFQHEIDHLDGILFIDKAVDIQDMPPDGKRNTKVPSKK